MQNTHHHSTISDPDDVEHEPTTQHVPAVSWLIFGGVAAGQDTTTQTVGGGFSIVGILEGMNKNGLQREGIDMEMPPTADAAIIAAKAEYAAAKMENVSAKLRLEQAQLQLERDKNEFSSFHTSN